jgi:protein phosphatase
LKFDYYGVSNCGPYRTVNQDSFCCANKIYYHSKNISSSTQKTISTTSEKLLFAIADGMGGHEAGEEASQFVLSNLIEKIKFENELELYNYRSLYRLVYDINSELNNFGKKINHPDAGTTLTGVILSNEHLAFCHVGDSRLYLFQDSKLEQVTVDHSVAFEMKDRAFKHYLTSCLGGGSRDIKIDISDMKNKVDKGSVLFMITDGMYDVLEDELFKDILTDNLDPTRFGKICMQEGLLRSPKDNLTVLAIRFLEL